MTFNTFFLNIFLLSILNFSFLESTSVELRRNELKELTKAQIAPEQRCKQLSDADAPLWEEIARHFNPNIPKQMQEKLKTMKLSETSSECIANIAEFTIYDALKIMKSDSCVASLKVIYPKLNILDYGNGMNTERSEKYEKLVMHLPKLSILKDSSQVRQQSYTKLKNWLLNVDNAVYDEFCHDVNIHFMPCLRETLVPLFHERIISSTCCIRLREELEGAVGVKVNTKSIVSGLEAMERIACGLKRNEQLKIEERCGLTIVKSFLQGDSLLHNVLRMVTTSQENACLHVKDTEKNLDQFALEHQVSSEQQNSIEMKKGSTTGCCMEFIDDAVSFIASTPAIQSREYRKLFSTQLEECTTIKDLQYVRDYLPPEYESSLLSTVCLHLANGFSRSCPDIMTSCSRPDTPRPN